MNRLIAMNTRQATRARFARFWCFMAFGLFKLGEKGS